MTPPATSRTPGNGFTLVEVLVALVVVALGMAALMQTLGSSADTLSWMRERTFSQWIASNQLALARLAQQQPQPGTTAGELDFAGRHWRWQQAVTESDIPGVVRIDVKVQPADTPLDNQHWTAMASGGTGDAIAPARLRSLYADPGQFYGSAPTSAPNRSSAPSPQPPQPPPPSPATNPANPATPTPPVTPSPEGSQ